MTSETDLFIRLAWQQNDWQRFQQFGERMPHALLVNGQAGLGKLDFALACAAYLLCESPNETPCGQCNNCSLVKSGNHPDLHLVFAERLALGQPEKVQAYAGRYLEDFDKAKKRKPRRIISVDQIRELIANAALSHHSASHKVVIIAPAESMNINAANALLKLLEEPPENTILMLVSSEPALLPITIRSRCVPFSLSTPNTSDSITWLEQQSSFPADSLQQALNLTAGAPLAALALLNDGNLDQFDTTLTLFEKLINKQSNEIETSDQLAKLASPAQVITWLQSIIRNTALSSHTNLNVQTGMKPISLLSKHPQLQTWLGSVKAADLYRFYDVLSEYKRHDVEQLNPQLLSEQLVIQFNNLYISKAA